MSEQREPGVYWVKRDAASEWEIVQVHPVDDWGKQSIDSMGWDAGACLPADAEWGPRVLPPGESVVPALAEALAERDAALVAARQLGDKADSMRLDVARTERDEATRELEAARRVVNVVCDRKATLGNGALSGVDKVRALMAALDEYVAVCGGPAAAERIMEQVEKESAR